ncbi:MAG: hypothetical protein ACRBCT_05345 [Alphaproteobacteria bacterium]
MSVRTDSFIQILDTIGAPLIEAVSRAHKDADAADLQKDAQAVAALLGKVVALSISMKETLDLKPEEAQNDALRVALAALAGPMVAAQYTQKNGQIPADNDLQRLQSSMQAVLTFADNFTPSEEMATRLGNLAAKGAPADAHQVNVQYVHAFLPVVEAIAAFSFGQPEQKLTMDVSDRLVKTAVEMRESLMADASGDDQKLCELAILRSLGTLYASCHTMESEKLAANPEGASLETVWKAFETRAAMLEAAVKNITPQNDVSAASNVAPAVPAAPMMDSSTATPAPPPVQPPAAPVAPPPAEAPATPAAETPPAGGAAQGGPMGFFAAPKAEESAVPATPEPPATPAPPPQAAPLAAAPQETPAADNGGGANPMGFFTAPNAGGEAPPPAAAPPPVQAEQPPAETPPAEGEASSGSPQGSPMSFFTKTDDED